MPILFVSVFRLSTKLKYANAMWIILNLEQWEKLKKAVKYIDRKIASIKQKSGASVK